MKKASDIVKEKLKDRNMSQYELAEKMGERCVQNLNQKLNRNDDMKVGFFSRLLEAMDYEIEIADKRNNNAEN